MFTILELGDFWCDPTVRSFHIEPYGGRTAKTSLGTERVKQSEHSFYGVKHSAWSTNLTRFYVTVEEKTFDYVYNSESSSPLKSFDQRWKPQHWFFSTEVPGGSKVHLPGIWKAPGSLSRGWKRAVASSDSNKYCFLIYQQICTEGEAHEVMKGEPSKMLKKIKQNSNVGYLRPAVAWCLSPDVAKLIGTKAKTRLLALWRTLVWQHRGDISRMSCK